VNQSVQDSIYPDIVEFLPAPLVDSAVVGSPEPKEERGDQDYEDGGPEVVGDGEHEHQSTNDVLDVVPILQVEQSPIPMPREMNPQLVEIYGRLLRFHVHLFPLRDFR
jgi:hypothetical protein